MKGAVAWLLLSSALLLLGLAYWLYASGNKARLREKVDHHFNQALPRGATITGLPPGKRLTAWHRLRVRASIYAGFELKDWHFLAIPALFVAFALLGWWWMRWTGALVLFGSTVFVIGFLVPYTRLQRRLAMIRTQVPVFIDQVLRALGTGRSVESAIRLAAEEAAPPLSHVLERVVRATDLGADMPETLSEAAALHGLKELNLIALAMRISSTYGSSPKEMLQSVMQMVRQREMAQRELASMTGETRISAWVLGLTPIGMAGYMIVANPGYLDLMLKEPSGQLTLELALGFQIVGVLVLWRMLRSI
jgi:tight adherence protein B